MLNVSMQRQSIVLNQFDNFILCHAFFSSYLLHSSNQIGSKFHGQWNQPFCAARALPEIKALGSKHWM
jgi:hypothetical protein